ncbi:unnamed protein product [Brassica oleracea]|uniref:Gfo/Idh/MocA-like oxidoreductase N-terminal domain-containing protein n=2 Tax=Brassica oleracea TaxID=3712 RepID=A0A0D3E3L9_BRAOL|nr:unnamed protein product [Brassica oleracea]VDC95284.1 unnamed protein product [Brassica oleracea]
MTGALTLRPIRLTASDTMVTIANWTFILLLHQIEINTIHPQQLPDHILPAQRLQTPRTLEVQIVMRLEKNSTLSDASNSRQNSSERYEELLDHPRVDAVYLTMPVTQRPKWAVTAAEKKKNLLVEKPQAQNAAEIDKIVEAGELDADKPGESGDELDADEAGESVQELDDELREEEEEAMR